MLESGNQAKGPANTGPHARSRTYFDSEGVRWHVYELPFSEYDRRSGASLIFDSDASMRRVRNFPADWDSLSDSELASLSWMT